MHKTTENNIRRPVWYTSCLPDSMLIIKHCLTRNVLGASLSGEFCFKVSWNISPNFVLLRQHTSTAHSLTYFSVQISHCQHRISCTCSIVFTLEVNFSKMRNVTKKRAKIVAGSITCIHAWFLS